MKFLWRIGVAAFLLATFPGQIGCTNPGSHGGMKSESRPGLPQAPTETFLNGDKIAVILTDIPNAPIASEQRIADDGEITLHLNYKLNAARKTRKQLQNEIHDYYVPKFYPRCTVTVKAEDRFFYVRGWVKAANRYAYYEDLTVLKAITAAGGFDVFGKSWEVHVTRLDGKNFIVNCEKALKDPKLDLAIYPGDQIFVPQRVWR
jgi:protein involved in polysaccharide export with SLBB domain